MFDSPKHSKRLRRPPLNVFERHLGVSDLSSVWNLSPNTIHRLFVDEPGVAVISHRKKGTRTGQTLIIPESVAIRVYRRLTKSISPSDRTDANSRQPSDAGPFTFGAARGRVNQKRHWTRDQVLTLLLVIVTAFLAVTNLVPIFGPEIRMRLNSGYSNVDHGVVGRRPPCMELRQLSPTMRI
jgi:hypothetical protein